MVKQGWLGISCSLLWTSHDPTTIPLLCCKTLPIYIWQPADYQILRHSCSGNAEFHSSLLLTMSCESELSASWFCSPTYLQHNPQCLNNSSKTICCPVSLTTPPQQMLVKFGSPVPLRSSVKLQSHHEAPFILHFTSEDQEQLPLVQYWKLHTVIHYDSCRLHLDFKGWFTVRDRVYRLPTKNKRTLFMFLEIRIGNLLTSKHLCSFCPEVSGNSLGTKTSSSHQVYLRQVTTFYSYTTSSSLKVNQIISNTDKKD